MSKFIAHGMVPKKVTNTSANEAANEFHYLHGVWPDEIEEEGAEFVTEVVGGCEVCHRAILDGEEYGRSADGIYFHKACWDAGKDVTF